MYQIAVVIFREFLEISILLGILTAIGRNIKDFKVYLLTGILIGCFGASLLAFFTEQLSDSLDGIGGEIFAASIILLTVIMLGYTIIWMKNYARELKIKMGKISEENSLNTNSGFFFVTLIAITIFREGSEIVLLLHSISTVQNENAAIYIQGFSIGAILGAICGVSIYLGLFKFASRYIFSISSFIMTFIAAGLAAEAAKILVSVGIIDYLTGTIWDTSGFASDDSVLGKILKLTIGYSARPSVIQFIFYLGTIITIVILNYFFSGKKSR